MEYTEKQALAGRAAAERLSPAAYAYYKKIQPFNLYEYKTPDGIRYAYSGIIGKRDNLTFEGLQYILEELHRLLCE